MCAVACPRHSFADSCSYFPFSIPWLSSQTVRSTRLGALWQTHAPSAVPRPTTAVTAVCCTVGVFSVALTELCKVVASTPCDWKMGKPRHGRKATRLQHADPQLKPGCVQSSRCLHHPWAQGTRRAGHMLQTMVGRRRPHIVPVTARPPSKQWPQWTLNWRPSDATCSSPSAQRCGCAYPPVFQEDLSPHCTGQCPPHLGRQGPQPPRLPRKPS